MFGRTKKLPKLKDLLRKLGQPEPKVVKQPITEEQLAAAMKGKGYELDTEAPPRPGFKRTWKRKAATAEPMGQRMALGAGRRR